MPSVLFFSFYISVLSLDNIEGDQVVKENAHMIEIRGLVSSLLFSSALVSF